MDYKALATKRTAGSPILADRAKLETDALIARYPEGITITDFDFLSGDDEKYVVCAFAEDPAAYFNGGKILTDIFNEFVSVNNGDVNFTRDDFKKSGGLRVKLYRGRTKKGNTVTLVDVL